MDRIARGMGRAIPVSMEQMLDARERRALQQQELLAKHGVALVSFTLNLPGEYKQFGLARRCFGVGCREVEKAVQKDGILLHQKTSHATTGSEGYFAVAGTGAAMLKKAMIELEAGHPLGRLFDLDVFDEKGVPQAGKDFGRATRPCLVCGGPVWECSRSRAHPAQELFLHALSLLEDYFGNHP